MRDMLVYNIKMSSYSIEKYKRVPRLS